MIITYHDLRNYSQTLEPGDVIFYSLDDRTYRVQNYDPRSNFLRVDYNGLPREILLFYVEPIYYENYTYTLQLGERL